MNYGTPLAMLAIPIVIALLLRSVSAQAKQKGTGFILEYGKGMKVFALLATLVAMGTTTLAASASEQDRWMAYAATAGMWLCAISLTLEFFLVEISFDSEGIHTRSPWRKSRFIPWTEVTGTAYSSVLQWHIIETRSLGSVRLHSYLSGSQTLLDRVQDVLARR